jgi:hypothetical protein
LKLQAVNDSATDQNFRQIQSLFPFGPDSLQRSVFRKVPELPAEGVEAEIVYLESTNTLHFYNGTEWKAL